MKPTHLLVFTALSVMGKGKRIFEPALTIEVSYGVFWGFSSQGERDVVQGILEKIKQSDAR